MNAPIGKKEETYYRNALYFSGGIKSRIKRKLLDLWQDKPRLHRLAMVWGTALVAAVAACVWLVGGRYTGTDNAYVRAAKLMVTTDVSGIVKSVEVRQGERVAKGQVLFRLDPKPFQIALDTDKATLAQTALDLASMKTEYKSLVGGVRAQEAEVRLAAITFRRYQKLAATNAVSAQQLDQAKSALQNAQSTLTSLKQNARTQLAKLNGDPDLPLSRYPGYRKALSEVAEAARQLDHTVVRAPFAGVVGEVDALQPGMLVVSSLSSFSTTSAVGLVSTSDMWVSADMKETDLTYVREGDPVEFTIDTYPGRTWHGTVQAISRASDSAFSILPSENNSANWVKVVQRIPVRIGIDQSAGAPPLRAGMSAVVTVDTHHRRWWRLMFGG
jgi:membrane fusion protein, multidrug efflux system